MTDMHNVNDNVRKETKETMSMNNDNVRGYEQTRNVERIADKLLATFKLTETSRPFMCKAAYKLSEAKIWDNAEIATKGRNPAGLFIFLCKRDGV